MSTGTITFCSGKGWYFAENDADHCSIFVHQKDVERQRYLRVADRIEFETAANPKHPDKTCAVNVRYLGHTVAKQTSEAGVSR
jgi:cold shock CspA family protein